MRPGGAWDLTRSIIVTTVDRVKLLATSARLRAYSPKWDGELEQRKSQRCETWLAETNIIAKNSDSEE